MSLRFYAKTQPRSRRPESELMQKPRASPPDEVILYYMAVFAQNLGFQSPQIASVVAHPPPDNMSSLSTTSVCPSFTQQTRARYLSGYPDIQSFKQDQSHLCWANFNYRYAQGAHMSTFCRLRSLCFAFFRLPGSALPLSSLFQEDQPQSSQVLSPLENMTSNDCDVISGPPEGDTDQSDVHRVARRIARGDSMELLETSRRGPITVYFKENKEYGWQEVRKIENANPKKVESVARELHERYNLIAVRSYSNRIESRTIAVDDCWQSAEESTINTILLTANRDKELHLDTIADLARTLFS